MIRRAKNLARRFIAGYNSVHSVETARSAPPSLAARLGHDQIQDAQIKLLDDYLEEAADRRVAETDIVNFFTARPEQAAVVSSSNYYLARYPHSVALRVAVLASLYVLEKDDECRLIADSLIAINDCDLHRYFQSRVAFAIDGHEAALKCLLDGEAKFRESYLLKLAIIACLVEKNEISAANDRLADIAMLNRTGGRDFDCNKKPERPRFESVPRLTARRISTRTNFAEPCGYPTMKALSPGGNASTAMLPS